MDNLNISKKTLKLLSDSIIEDRDSNFRLFEHADKIIVWLVGFSITLIILIFNYQLNSNSAPTDLAITIVVLLSLCVISGILYRVFSFVFRKIEFRLLNDFKFFIHGFADDGLDIGREIKLEDSYEEVVEYIRQDFGDIKTVYEKLPKGNVTLAENINRSEKTKEIKKLYEEIRTSITSENTKIVKSILHERLGISEKRIEKAFNNSGKVKFPSIYLFLSTTFYILTCLLFIASFFIILLWFLSLNN